MISRNIKKLRHLRFETVKVSDLGKMPECATDGCGKQAIFYYESGDVGSVYCGDCGLAMLDMLFDSKRVTK